MKRSPLKTKLYAGLILLVIVAVTVFFIQQIRQKSRMETNLDKYMPKNHPAFVYSDQAEEWFNIKDGILIAIENPDGIYNSVTLEKIKDISRKLQKMPEFDDNDVTSLYTVDNIEGTEYGLEVNAFYSRAPKDAEALDELRQNVRENDMIYGRVVSRDETAALIVAGMESEYFTDDFYREILAFAGSYEDENNTIYVAGRPIVEGTMGKLGPKDMQRMVPIVLVVITGVLLLLLRSFRATFATLLTVFVSTIWAFGLMAVLGIPIYSVSTMIPVMLIAIGVAYGIYFYNHLKQYAGRHPRAEESTALAYTIKILWKPLAMAAFTTMIGFISLLTSEVYPIKYFGIFTAFGIFSAFLMALILLPVMVILMGYHPGKKKEKAGSEYNLFIRFTDGLLARKKTIYIAVLVIVTISLFGIQRVWINSSFLDKFEKDSDIVKTDTFVNSKFGGTSTLNVVLESPDADTFKKPESLRLIDRLQAETVKLDRVGNSFSLADYLKRMNKVMNEDREEFYAIPETRNMVAQYLLLYEMSGDPENLLKVTNYDYSKANVTFQLKGDDSKTINEALAVIKSFEDDFRELGIEMNFAGSGYKALVFTDLILEGQIKSIVMSLFLVLGLLILMFRSIKAGLIGATPILITILINFGFMGILNIALSTTTALLSSIAMGVGIDYAIHFLQHYRMNLASNPSKETALYATMNQTGKAILYNAVVVISGFLVLLFSVFPPNRTLGALVSMNMFTSLTGTLTIMMILVYTCNLFITKRKEK